MFLYGENGFGFYCPTRVYFGPGMLKKLGQIELPGKKAFICTYPTTGYNTEKVLEQLKLNGCDYYLHDKVTPNPLTADVDAAADIARAEKCDFTIGIGGGSAIDTAKAVAVLLKNPGKIWDYVGVDGPDGKRIVDRVATEAAPIVAISTTSGTGTDVDPSSVVVNSETKFKSDLTLDILFPQISIIDPELQVTIPKVYTASQGMDAIFHIIEGLLTVGCEANRLAEIYGKAGVELAAKWLPIAVKEPENLEARTNVALLNLLAGYVEDMTWLKTLHGIGMAFNCFAPNIPHGLAMCIVSLECFKKYVAEQPERCAMMSEWVGYGHRAEGLLEWLVDIQKEIGMYNIDYHQYGLSIENADKYAANAYNAGNGLFEFDVNRMTLEEATQLVKDAFIRCDTKVD